MKVAESPCIEHVIETKTFAFGTFHFLDRCVISEINEGVTFVWQKAIEVIAFGEEFYGKGVRINYI